MSSIYIGLIFATLFALISASFGLRSILNERKNHLGLLFLGISFIIQCYTLHLRGEMRGQCPLGDLGEIFIFTACSISLFYLIIGSYYRHSLLGLFSAPLLSIFLLCACIPGLLTTPPFEKPLKINAWEEMHAAFSILSYGGFALAAISGLMFLLLNKRLKSKEINSKLFSRLPPIHFLTHAMDRLIFVGLLLLTFGFFCGIKMTEHFWNPHLLAASILWLLYVILLTVKWSRGIAPVQFSAYTIALFLLSLCIFSSL